MTIYITISKMVASLPKAFISQRPLSLSLSLYIYIYPPTTQKKASESSESSLNRRPRPRQSRRPNTPPLSSSLSFLRLFRRLLLVCVCCREYRFLSLSPFRLSLLLRPSFVFRLFRLFRRRPLLLPSFFF